MKHLNQPQKSHSNFGTMKNGMNIGPTSTHTAVAMNPKAITTIAMAWAAASKIMMTT